MAPTKTSAKKSAERHSIQEALSLLKDEDKKRVEKLNNAAVSRGYEPKISAMGDKEGEWKCEYAAKKNVLLIIRISGAQWSARCKLYHLSGYNDMLEQCNKHCIDRLLANAKNCGSHGGGCKGPVSFSAGGEIYSKCRHHLLFDDITDEDAGDIEKLLIREAESAGAASSLRPSP